MNKAKRGLLYILITIMTFTFMPGTTVQQVHAQVGGDYTKQTKSVISKRQVKIFYSKKECKKIVKYCDKFKKAKKIYDNSSDAKTLYAYLKYGTCPYSYRGVMFSLFLKGVDRQYSNVKKYFNAAVKKGTGIRITYTIKVYGNTSQSSSIECTGYRRVFTNKK